MKAQVKLVKHQTQYDLIGLNGVIGVGHDLKVTDGVVTEEECITVLVEEKKPLAQLADSQVVPKEIGGVKTDVVAIGRQHAQVIQGGSSCGAPSVTAGTLTLRFKDRFTGAPVFMSNWHVLVDDNNAVSGMPELSPGVYDGGTVELNTVGRLLRFVPLYFHGELPPDVERPPVDDCAIAGGAAAIANFAAHAVGSRFRLFPVNMQAITQDVAVFENTVDGAIATIIDDLVKPGLKYFGEVSGINTQPAFRQHVSKYGRTTALTEGQIVSQDTLIDVGYGGGRTARFKNQLVITNANGQRVSAGGDSGSLFVDDENHAVALLFAGSDTATIANPIAAVMAALKVDLEI